MSTYALSPARQQFRDSLFAAAAAGGAALGDEEALAYYTSFLDTLVLGMPATRFCEAIIDDRLTLRSVLAEHGNDSDKLWLAKVLPGLRNAEAEELQDFRVLYMSAWYMAASNHAPETGDEFHVGDIKDAIHEALYVMSNDELIEAVLADRDNAFDNILPYFGMEGATDDLVVGLNNESLLESEHELDEQANADGTPSPGF